MEPGQLWRWGLAAPRPSQKPRVGLSFPTWLWSEEPGMVHGGSGFSASSWGGWGESCWCGFQHGRLGAGEAGVLGPGGQEAGVSEPACGHVCCGHRSQPCTGGLPYRQARAPVSFPGLSFYLSGWPLRFGGSEEKEGPGSCV